jgi:hypothetical protein
MVCGLEMSLFQKFAAKSRAGHGETQPQTDIYMDMRSIRLNRPSLEATEPRLTTFAAFPARFSVCKYPAMFQAYARLECRVCRETKAVHPRNRTEEIAHFHCSACGSKVPPREVKVEGSGTNRLRADRFCSITSL